MSATFDPFAGLMRDYLASDAVATGASDAVATGASDPGP